MNEQIDTLLSETRRFPPPPEFSAQAPPATDALYDGGPRSGKRSGKSRHARSTGSRPGRKVLDWRPPHARWFVDGKLNASANCLDRHLAGPRRNKAAIIWEGEPGDRRVLTYWDLAREVGRCANALKGLGIRRGDRVAIYLPDDPRGGHRHAGVRPNRRGALGCLRRLLRGVAARPDQRRRGCRGHHGGRCVPPGPGRCR